MSEKQQHGNMISKLNNGKRKGLHYGTQHFVCSLNRIGIDSNSAGMENVDTEKWKSNLFCPLWMRITQFLHDSWPTGATMCSSSGGASFWVDGTVFAANTKAQRLTFLRDNRSQLVTAFTLNLSVLYHTFKHANSFPVPVNASRFTFDVLGFPFCHSFPLPFPCFHNSLLHASLLRCAFHRDSP